MQNPTVRVRSIKNDKQVVVILGGNEESLLNFGIHGIGRPQALPHLHHLINNGAITRLMMDISFMSMFIAGPEVSLNGSPTVSPTTAAL